MVVFTAQNWISSLIVTGAFALIILIPCIIVALMARSMIYRLGQKPSSAPVIHLSIFFQMLFLEVVTFSLMIFFYRFFSTK